MTGGIRRTVLSTPALFIFLVNRLGKTFDLHVFQYCIRDIIITLVYDEARA